MNKSQKIEQKGKTISTPALVFGVLVLAVAVIFVVGKMQNNSRETAAAPVEGANNVSVVDGKQVIELHAKGGYKPSVSTAKAGIPTVLKVDTSGTFDCSSSIRIPSLNISQVLPASGVTEIALGNLNPGTIQGTCGMGMYHFQINAQS